MAAIMAMLQVAFQAKAEPQVNAVVLDAALHLLRICVVAMKASMPCVNSRLIKGSAKFVA